MMGINLGDDYIPVVGILYLEGEHPRHADAIDF